MHAYMHTYTHPYIRSTNIDPDMRRVHVTLTSTYLHRYPYHTGTGTAHHHRQKSSPITTHHLFQLSLCATRLAHPSVSWQHPSNLPASSGLETQHRPPSFLLSPDGRTSRASYMPHTLECHQNSSYGLGRPSPNRRALSSAAPAVGPRLPDRRNTRPSYTSLVLSAGITQPARSNSFLREAFGLWPGQSLPATHTRPVIPCSARNTITTLLRNRRVAVASTAPRSLHVHQSTLFSLVLVLPASICDPRPCPVLPQEATMRRRGVVCTPGSGSDRPIDSPPPNRDLTCLPASCNPAPAVSHKAADQGTRVRSPSASAETPVQFHPNENRLQTRNTPAESQLPGSPNSPHVFPFRAFRCPRRVCRKPFEPSH
jgi:hypothetical protein